MIAERTRVLKPQAVCRRWGDCEGADFWHRVRDPQEPGSNAPHIVCARSLSEDEALDGVCWTTVEKALWVVAQVERKKALERWLRETLVRFYLERTPPGPSDETALYRLWSVVRRYPIIDVRNLEE